MMYKKKQLTVICFFFFCVSILPSFSQVNTNRVLSIGKNALYFEDYVLSIQYFNQVIKSKPQLAEPYLYRALAKLNLDDYRGAENDLTLCLDRNPFLVQAYFLRGIARQNQNDYENAVEDYSKGLLARPEDKQILLNKGIAYAQMKDYSNALEVLDELINYHPKYPQAYLTRGSIYAEKEDTLLALENFERAIDLDKYFAPSFAQRAMIYYMQEKYPDALADYNQAIHLEPKQTAYYINRGLVLYNLNDLRGSMADYNAVILLEPQNTIARFNRGLLRAQVGAASQAIEDFNEVIKNEPDNYMAIYNRALLNEEVKNYQAAVNDLNTVLEEYPYFVPGYYFRAEVKQKMNKAKDADKDYWYAYDLEQKLLEERRKGKTVTGKEIRDADSQLTDSSTNSDKNIREKSDKDIEKFNRMVMYDREEEIRSSYKNEIRGRIQDKQVKVDLSPQFVITYYEKIQNPDMQKSYYDRNIQDYNARKFLPYQLKITNQESPLTDQQATFHFQSINDYSLLIVRDSLNADLYFARGMDYMVLQDLSEAMDDFSKAIRLNPRFFMAYFNRAAIRYKQLEMELFGENSPSNTMKLQLKNQPLSFLSQPQKTSYVAPDDKFSSKIIELNDNKLLFEFNRIIEDYNKVIELNPDFIYAYFNRANIRCTQQDFRAALPDYDEAINRNPAFAEAYYNRGLTRLHLGDTQRGIADLSKAGELGIIEAYSIIKKMTSN